jgi:hypothetical protein
MGIPHIARLPRKTSPVLIFAMIICFIWMALFFTAQLMADPVPVHVREGLQHGYLVVRTTNGDTIANGEMTQVSLGNLVTVRLVFHFKDGSVQDETTTYTQDRTFRLVKDHLIQKGPSFKDQLDALVDAGTGWAVFKYAGENGKENVVSGKLQMPPDVYNGMIPTLLENLQPGDKPVTVSMVVPTPKPRIVKLTIHQQGTAEFAAGTQHEAIQYVLSVDLGGVASALAPLVGKQPPNTHIWISSGDAPAFLRMEGPFFDGGPTWRIETVNPTWPDLPYERASVQ